MNLNFRAIFRILGMLLVIIGVSMIPSLIVAILYSEKESVRALAFTILPTILLGASLVRLLPPFSSKLKSREGILIVASCWLLASIIGALPFVLSGAIPSLIDALFESSSGFSTTGSSILTDIEVLPKSLLFWRSFTHWLGGMGILVFAIALLPALGIGGATIAKAETTGPSLDRLVPKFSDSAKILYFLYLLFTLVETFLLLTAGMSLYDALVHTFGTVGTGGFSTYNSSIAYYDSTYINLIISVFMLLSGVSFPLYYAFLRHGPREFARNGEFKLYLKIICIATLLIAVNLYFSGVYNHPGVSLEQSLFQVSSILTTTGYATANYDLWPTFSKMVIFCLMLVGGCSASTSGGIKVIRILVILKLIRRGMAVRLHPNAVVTLKHEEKVIAPDIVSNIANFVFLYIAVIFISSILVSLNGFDLLTSISAVITCIGNIGPGFELVGPVMNFSIFADPIKLLLSFLMLAGRLELFTIIMLLSPRFWNPDR